MPILNFLSVLKRIAPVCLYPQDPLRGEDMDCSEGVLSLYADKYAYVPKKACLSKRDDSKAERQKAVMRSREIEYRSVIGFEAQFVNEKTLCLAVKTQGDETDYFIGPATQMRSTAEILRSRIKAAAPQLADAQPGAAQGRADSPGDRRPGTLAGLKIPLINLGPQEKLCKFCDTSYPAKALYCPNCGAFETKRASSGKKQPAP